MKASFHLEMQGIYKQKGKLTELDITLFKNRIPVYEMELDESKRVNCRTLVFAEGSQAIGNTIIVVLLLTSYIVKHLF